MADSRFETRSTRRLGRMLFDDGTIQVQARDYLPNERMAPHRDAQSRFTFTLRGQFAEVSERGDEAVISPGDVLMKSNGELHEDRFGPSGATLVSVVLLENAETLFDSSSKNWSVQTSAEAARTAVLTVEAACAGDGHTLRAALIELADWFAPSGPMAAVRPPRWLESLRDEVEQTGLAKVNFGERAKAAGVHPVHGSRLFRRYFGRSITEHANMHAIRRAMAALGDGATLADAALDCGFYDQSHMSRVFRRVMARTPGQYRRLVMAAC